MFWEKRSDFYFIRKYNQIYFNEIYSSMTKGVDFREAFKSSNKYKLRRDETQVRIDKLRKEVDVSRMLQSSTIEEYEEYWEERVEWLLESIFKEFLYSKRLLAHLLEVA